MIAEWATGPARRGGRAGPGGRDGAARAGAGRARALADVKADSSLSRTSRTGSYGGAECMLLVLLRSCHTVVTHDAYPALG